MASILRKSSNKVPITIFQMLLAGRRAHKNKALFMGSRGFLWVRIMGSQNVMGLVYGSNISAFTKLFIYFLVKLFAIRHIFKISILRWNLHLSSWKNSQVSDSTVIDFWTYVGNQYLAKVGVGRETTSSSKI
jgi:hypothetical protein